MSDIKRVYVKEHTILTEDDYKNLQESVLRLDEQLKSVQINVPELDLAK